jgi:hypothetical protein
LESSADHQSISLLLTWIIHREFRNTDQLIGKGLVEFLPFFNLFWLFRFVVFYFYFDCPQSYPGGKPHGVNKIVTAHETLTANGVPVAVEGCTTECGCKLLGSLPATVS